MQYHIVYKESRNIKNVGLCNLTESEFQSKYNTDLDTKIMAASDEMNKQFIADAKAMLFSA